MLLGLGRGSVPGTVEHVALLADSPPDGTVWASDHAGVVVDLLAGT